MDLLRDHFEAAVLESSLEPEQPSTGEPGLEESWLTTSRIGYDADTLAVIEREPEILWFG